MRRLLVIAATIVATLFGMPAIAGAATPGYIALGDSYSSGLGTGSYSLSAACKRGTKAYPYLSGVTAANFKACTGATVPDVAGQLTTVLPNPNLDITLVTLTVGGNDIGFSTVVSNCTAFSSDQACKNAVVTATDEVTKIKPMRDNLIGLLQQIRAKAPNARVVLLGYPYLYSKGPTCGFGQPSQVKRTALYGGADTLNKALEDAVDAVPGTQYVNVRPIFAAHSICASGSARWINGLNFFNQAESFHPNANGHLLGYKVALANAPVTART